MMNARTELLLYQLGWTVDKLMRPTWRALDQSFESWAYGNGLLRQVQRLEARAYLEARRDPRTGERVIRLTEKGIQASRVTEDPEQRWHAPWDGKWRMVLFDLPEKDRKLRRRLRDELCRAHFGCLQKSVWISPRSLSDTARQLKSLPVAAGSLLLLEGLPCGGETPADIARAAWDFSLIHEAWNELDRHLGKLPGLASKRAKQNFAQWSAKEHELLSRCLRLDPLLPEQLLPPDYAGQKVWQRRRKVIRRILLSLPV